MNTDINNTGRRENNRAFAGLFLIVLGGLFLLRQLDFIFFPTWLFSWPVILIVIGIISGIKHNFTRPGAYVMISIGTVFLLGRILCVSIHFFWPFILIAIGVSMLMGRNRAWYRDHWNNRNVNYHHNNRVDL